MNFSKHQAWYLSVMELWYCSLHVVYKLVSYGLKYRFCELSSILKIIPLFYKLTAEICSVSRMASALLIYMLMILPSQKLRE